MRVSAVIWGVAVLGTLAGSAAARELEEILEDKGVITNKEAAESRAAREKSGGAVAPALPDWVRKVTLFGDIRVRNESFFREDDPDRVRQRFRLRVGARVAVNDETEIGMRLASGDPDDPISNNQTFTDVFTFKKIAISNAYLKLAPSKSIGASRPYATLMGGKFDVPVYFPTRLVFDGDLTPEGFFEAIDVVRAREGALRTLQMNLGQWIFQEISKSSDGVIFAFQGVAGFAPGRGVVANVGIADYLFHKPSAIATARNTNKLLVVTNRVRLADGSVLGGRKIDPAVDGAIAGLVSDFNLVNVGTDATVATGVPGWPLKIFGEGVINTKAKGSDDTGFQVGAAIGSAKEPGDVSLSYAYQRLETDAVLSTFTDSDFGRDGGTNSKGHILQLNYVLLKGLQFTTTAWITKPVASVAGRNSNTDYRWQVDLTGKF